MFQGRTEVIWTYRWLRVGMIGMAVAIVGAALVQRFQSSCWLTSISAYWYTPARAVFVAGLTAIAFGLLALRGSTWTENFLLNAAGALAPVVAISPTTLDPEMTCIVDADFRTVIGSEVDNGMTIYLVAFGVCWAVGLAILAWRWFGTAGLNAMLRQPVEWVGPLLGAAGFVVYLSWFLANRDNFDDHAHFRSAIVMFGFIELAVLCRTPWGLRLVAKWDRTATRETKELELVRRTDKYSWAYAGVALVMVASTVLAGLSHLRGWYSHTVILIEVWLLIWFCVFWALQTIQLRDTDLDYDTNVAA